MKPESTAPKPLTAEQRALVEENHNLIYGYLHKRGLNVDDWYGCCALAMCRAATMYDAEKGAFATYCYTAFSNAIHVVLRDTKRRDEIVKFVSLTTQIRTHGDTETDDIVIQIPVEDPGYDRVETADVQAKTEARLRDTERTVLALRLAGLSNAEIGKLLGVTPQRISKRLERIREKTLIELGREKKKGAKKTYHMSGKRFTPEETQEIWEKYCKDPSKMKKICEEHDIVVSTAYIWLRKMGYDVDTVKRSHVCVVCGKAFTGHAAAKTCSPECKEERKRQYTYNRYHHLPTDPPSRSQLDNKTAAQIAAEAKAHGGMSYGKYVALVEGN